MSGNSPREPDTTELSLPDVTMQGSGDAVCAPGAIQASRDSREPLPTLVTPPREDTVASEGDDPVTLDRLYAHDSVSGTLAMVDATQSDHPYDTEVFEKEPLSMRSASCAAFSTRLDDATVQQIVSRGTRTFRKVSSSPAGSVWIFSCSGERSPVPTAEIYDEIREASVAGALPVPSVMFLLYQGQHDVSSILDTFQQEVGSGFSLLTTGSLFVGDEHFVRATQHPRVKVYVDVELRPRAPQGLGGRRFHHMTLRPAIHTIRAGGAEKQYGREAEEKRIHEWVDATFRSGKYSSMTIHGDAMMGKTRMAAEIVRYVQQQYPDATLVFAPAMDTHKSDPFHYAKTFAKRLVDGFSSHPDISNTIIYRDLAGAVRGSSNISISTLSSLLISFFQLLSSSSAKLFLIPDDMQWPDAESNFFFTKIFRENITFRNIAVLNLTRTGDEVMSPELLAAMRAETSDEIHLKPLAFLSKSGEPTRMLSAFVADLLHVPEFDVPSGTDYLRRLAKISQGNAGILTEVVCSMHQDGVISTVSGRLSVDHTRFMAWTETGEADNIIVTKVDRLLQNEHYRDVLMYFVAFRESGGCDADLFLKFLTNVLKQPKLAEAYTRLVAQQTIGLQQIGDLDEPTLSFSQDLVGARLKKEFTDGSSPYAMAYVAAHRTIARFMSDMDTRLNRQKNPHMAAILERCSPRAIVTHALAGGDVELARVYAIQALRTAYDVGDHAATLDIYRSVIQSDSELLMEVARDDDLQLSVLHSMTILRKDWSEMAIALGDNLKRKYLDLLSQSESHDGVLVSRIERLYDLMCTFYFLRGTVFKLRDESIQKLIEWGSGFGINLFSKAGPDVGLREGMFMDLKASFYRMLAEYMQQRYVQACEMFASQFEIRREALYRQSPEIEQDPRCQRLNLEATRVSANARLMGFNRAVTPGLEGVDLAYDDEESCIVSSRDPNSSIYDHLLEAEKLFRSYLDQAAARPDQVMDRAQVYRAKQGFARTLGMLGWYCESFERFLDARSDAHRYGDPERFADITDAATSMLTNMVKHFLSWPEDRVLQKTIVRIASLIRRSEQGESPDNQDLFASLQYILKKAHQYSEQAARITADIGHSSNFDTAMVNILLIIETMVSSYAAFNEPVDSDLLLLLDETMRRVLGSDSNSAADSPTPSFFERMTALDAKGNSGEYWNLYVGPCLARLAVELAQFDNPNAREISANLLTELGNCTEGRANLLDSLHALVQERFTPKKARLDSYDRAVNSKRIDVETAMNLMEERGLIQYNFAE